MVGNEGEKSFIKLFAEYYGGRQFSLSETGDNKADTIILLTNFTIIRGGHYGWKYGLDSRTVNGYYWSVFADSSLIAHYQLSSNMYLYYQNIAAKGDAFSLRCVARSPKKN